MFPKTQTTSKESANSKIVTVKNVGKVKKSNDTSKAKSLASKISEDCCSLEMVQVQHQQPRCQPPPLPNKAMAFFDPDCDLFMKIALNAYDEHLSELVSCSRCGRKFFPDRIARHESTCAANPLKNVLPTKQKLPGGTQKRKSLIKANNVKK